MTLTARNHTGHYGVPPRQQREALTCHRDHRSWLVFYQSVHTDYVKLLPAADARRDAIRRTNSHLEAFEGVKLRVLFERAICEDPAEEDRIVRNLVATAGLVAAKSANDHRAPASLLNGARVLRPSR